MQKLNCWQFKNCGREKDGLLVDILGECPVSISMKHDGRNDGCAAGRYCWTVHKLAGSSCGQRACHTCDFYRRVVFEEEGAVCGQFSSVECS